MLAPFLLPVPTLTLTTHTAEYKARCVLAPFLPPLPTLTLTTHTAEYKARSRQPERTVSCKKDQPLPKTTPFEGGSTYREQFPWRPVTPRAKAVAPKASGWEPQPHAQPMQSTYRSQFVDRPLPDRTSAKPKHVPLPFAPFDGETTSSAQFKWHEGVHKRQSLKAADTREHVAHPFAGRSTYSDAYKAYGALPPVVARKPPDERQHTSMAKFDGTTAHREQFKEMRLPSGSSWELGVQVVDGKFHPMIAKGKRPPCEGRATFTTVVDLQESVEIVVVGRAPNVNSVHLGHFECDTPQYSPVASAPRVCAPCPPHPPNHPTSRCSDHTQHTHTHAHTRARGRRPCL